MGFLDSLNISPELKSMLGEISTAAAPVILSEVMGNGSQGGLTAVVNKLEQAGFGNQVKSWIGTGQNIPITSEELQQALGNEKVKELAARFNIPIDQVGPILAQLLPSAVDHASPGGTLPHTA
ncbi:MAG: YidB family protein [Xanthobacteraceae bacterium]|nr:YidB family protein [Xanthobacteraceae bacterium]